MPYTSAEPVWGIAYSKWHAFEVRRTDRLCLNRLPAYARGNKREQGILFLFVETFATFKHTTCDRILEKKKKKRGINTAALRFSPPFDSRDRVNTH